MDARVRLSSRENSVRARKSSREEQGAFALGQHPVRVDPGQSLHLLQTERRCPLDSITVSQRDRWTQTARQRTPWRLASRISVAGE